MAYKLFGGKKPQMNNESSMKTSAAMYASKTSMYGKKPMMDGGPGDKIPPPPKEKGYEYAVWNKKYGDAYKKQEGDKLRAQTQKMINERKAAAATEQKKQAQNAIIKKDNNKYIQSHGSIASTRALAREFKNKKLPGGAPAKVGNINYHIENMLKTQDPNLSDAKAKSLSSELYGHFTSEYGNKSK